MVEDTTQSDTALEQGPSDIDLHESHSSRVDALKDKVDLENDDDATARESTALNPPASCGERMRDAILRALDHPIMQYFGIFVLVGVVASGALFFFFLMGWQAMCRPRTDCQPRNDIYNASVQTLNGFFTYMASVSMPWRCTNAIHTWGWGCPRRENTPGHDLYGRPTNDVWFHVSLRKRTVILIFLLLNCITQYVNQATRIIYWNYELQDKFPGNLWTNVFFCASMVCAAVGGALLGYHTGKLRKQHPGKFGPGPVELVKDLYRQYFGKYDKENDSNSVSEVDLLAERARGAALATSAREELLDTEPGRHERPTPTASVSAPNLMRHHGDQQSSYTDPTSHLNRRRKHNERCRSSMRLYAM